MGRQVVRSVPSEKVRLINQLTHTKGPFAGQSFHLRRWQERQIIRPLFAIDPATGRRKYRTCLLMMPRKNGKTELCAALAIDTSRSSLVPPNNTAIFMRQK